MKKTPRTPLRIASLAEVRRWDRGEGELYLPHPKSWGQEESWEKKKKPNQKPRATHFSTAGRTAA